MGGTFTMTHPLSWAELCPQKRYVQVLIHSTCVCAFTLCENEVFADVTEDVEMRGEACEVGAAPGVMCIPAKDAGSHRKRESGLARTPAQSSSWSQPCGTVILACWPPALCALSLRSPG